MFVKLGAIALAAGTIMVATAGPSAAYNPRAMVSRDETRPGGPRIHDNGVNDGRFCVIRFEQVWDRWTEDWITKKVKRCKRI